MAVLPARAADDDTAAVKEAAMKLGGKVQPESIHIFVGEDLAVFQNYEKGKNTNVDGKATQVSLRATSIFRKEDGEWKMISHQSDQLAGL